MGGIALVGYYHVPLHGTLRGGRRVPSHAAVPHNCVQSPAHLRGRHLHTAAPDAGATMQLFQEFEWWPLASATVAQVHTARAHSGAAVAVKVQHRGVRRMMLSDLLQLRLLTAALRLLRVDLGFDVASIVREYCVQVPHPPADQSAIIDRNSTSSQLPMHRI